MTQWLVRHFVKDSENIKNAQVRSAYTVLGSSVGIAANLFLFVLKLVLGLCVHSVAVLADSFNNLSDAASSIVSFVGIRMAGKPADKEHPFGHGRIEYIAALIIAFLVLMVGFDFLKDAVDRILHPQEIVFYPFVIVGLAVSILVKIWLGFFYRKLGAMVSSKVLKATGTDAFADVLATTATLVSVLLFSLFEINVDGVIGLLVAILILVAGVGIVRDTMKPLIGETISPEVYHEIEDFVKSHEGILNTHDLIVHSYGPAKSMASIHAEVNSKQDVMALHEIIDRIEREAENELGIILVIHMDPIEIDSEEVSLAHHRVSTIVRNLDPRLSIHDFRMMSTDKQIKLYFDMVVPYDFDEEKEHDFQQRLEAILQLEDERYHCVITFDKSFIGE